MNNVRTVENHIAQLFKLFLGHFRFFILNDQCLFVFTIRTHSKKNNQSILRFKCASVKVELFVCICEVFSKNIVLIRPIIINPPKIWFNMLLF